MIQREKKTKVKVGYIGLGRRGYSMLSRCFANMADVDFAWVCDLSQEKLDRAVQTLTEAGRHEPKTTTNYHDILADPDVDAVIVMTGWDMHVQCSLDSLKAGKGATDKDIGKALFALCSAAEMRELDLEAILSGFTDSFISSYENKD